MDEITDGHLLLLFSEWSEDTLAASFQDPTPNTVRRFREWLRNQGPQPPMEDFERTMIAEYRRQEAEG